LQDSETATKQRLFEIIWGELDPNLTYVMKFEAIDRLRSLSLDERDILKVLEVLERHPDLMVRHEAAFVLLDFEEKNPSLSKKMRAVITNALSKRARYDKSLVVRHETLEALGYVGDESCMNLLLQSTKSRNKDIRESALFALQLLRFRLSGAPLSELLSRYPRNSSHQPESR